MSETIDNNMAISIIKDSQIRFEKGAKRMTNSLMNDGDMILTVTDMITGDAENYE